MKGGNLTLITKPGIEVDTDEVTLIGGTAKVHPAAGWTQPATLRIEITGRNTGGSIVARPPVRSFWQWLLRRPRPYQESVRRLTA